MIPIQWVLIAGLLLAVGLYFARLRSRLLDRVLVIAFLAISVGFVLKPELTTALAHRIGVGRGADMVFYLSILGLGFMVTLLFSNLRELHGKVTRLSREIALMTSTGPDQKPPVVPR